MHAVRIVQAVLLLTLANGTPVVAKKVFGPHFGFPLDAGILLFDGRPVFGPSKTIRGVIASVVVTAIGGVFLGLNLSSVLWWRVSRWRGICSPAFEAAPKIFRQAAKRWDWISYPNCCFRFWRAGHAFAELRRGELTEARTRVNAAAEQIHAGGAPADIRSS